jgi:tripartite-type tricarboxylate transporter receptor subunit TctC
MRFLSILMVASLLPLAAAAQPAPAFPARPIRLLVPFGPGGGTDVTARSIGEYIGGRLGQPVVVENRPGGNSVIASDLVAKASPDGHTLLLTTDIHAINGAYGTGLPYDSIKDFAFVSQLTTSPLMLVAHPASGIRSIAGLVAAAKAAPDKLSFGSLGSSSPHYLGFEWFKQLAGIRVIDVPYKGGGQVTTDVLGGQVNLALIVVGNGIRQARAGKLHAVAVTSEMRTAVASDVPTVAESGFPGYSLVNWYGIMAPAATPAAIVSRLNSEINGALKTPAIAERLSGVGLDVAPSTPAQFEALVKRDIDKYRRIIELTGAKPEGK